MTIGFEYDNKIIANAELSLVPSIDQHIKIWNENYIVINVYQNVEIKMKNNNKKVVVEKIICTLNKDE